MVSRSGLALALFVCVSTATGIAALVLARAPKTNPVETAAVFQTRKITDLASKIKNSPENHNVRDVGGGVVAASRLPDMALERIAPAPVQRQPELFGPPVQVVSPQAPFLLFQPIVENAGVLIAEGRSIRLLGVEPVEAGRICQNAQAIQWPCGMKARTEFRAFVRGRAISCLLPDQQKASIETECTVGKKDLGQWLVEQGWASAKPGSALEKLGKAAQLMGRGIYGKGN